MISLIIPTYRNPKYLDLCLQSAIDGQTTKNEIIVVIDGYIDESQEVIDKYQGKINVLPLPENKGMQTALNLGVYNANNEKILIVNDDNVLCPEWDVIASEVKKRSVITINQIEPTGPSIFNFPIKNFGKTFSEFDYKGFIEYEKTLRQDMLSVDGGIFPFSMYKKQYMIVGGFDTLYNSPFICDWDFFLKLDLNNIGLARTHKGHFYHFGSTATKNRTDNDQIKFKESEQPAAQTFMYKWGIPPQLFENCSHNPKNNKVIKGIKYE